MKQTRQWMLFLCAAVATFVALRAGDARASWRQYSVRANCAIMSPSPSYTGGTGDQIFNTSTTDYLELSCALLESDAFTKGAVTSATLSYTDNNGGSGGGRANEIYAASCVAYASATGGICNNANATTGTGSSTLNVNLSTWSEGCSTTCTYASDFGYVYVSIPPQYSSANSGVWGYRITI